MSFFEQKTTKKERVDKRVTELEAGDSQKYKVEAIWNSAIYASKSKSSQLPGLYYLIVWKGYPKEENTWEPLSVVQTSKSWSAAFTKSIRKSQ